MDPFTVNLKVGIIFLGVAIVVGICVMVMLRQHRDRTQRLLDRLNAEKLDALERSDRDQSRFNAHMDSVEAKLARLIEILERNPPNT